MFEVRSTNEAGRVIAEFDTYISAQAYVQEWSLKFGRYDLFVVEAD